MARAGDRLVAVGQRGHILYSDDVGKHWQQAAVPVSADLNAVSFPTATQGWAVGNDGVILHSERRGCDLEQTTGRPPDRRLAGQALPGVGQCRTRATNNGRCWSPKASAWWSRAPTNRLLDVWFANDRLGYVVGVFNLILRTEDGGQSWTPFQDRTDNPQGFHLNAIASTGDALYIAGEQGLLLKWDDARQRFAAVQTPYQGSFFGVVGKPGEVLVYGLRGNVLRSTDGGLSWTPLDSGLQVSITAGIVDARGHYRLFTQGGQMLVSQGVGAQLHWTAASASRSRWPVSPAPPTVRWWWSAAVVHGRCPSNKPSNP